MIVHGKGTVDMKKLFHNAESPVTLFCCYAKADEPDYRRLEKHLEELKQEGALFPINTGERRRSQSPKITLATGFRVIAYCEESKVRV
jgi:hypothetical protein